MEITLCKKNIINIINNNSVIEIILQNICDALKQNVPHYDWVGFYFKNGNKKELKLAQFSGEPTRTYNHSFW